MPKKKTHVHRGQGRNKKKNKYKLTPAEGPKKDEEEKIEVSDKDQGNSSTDTPSGNEKGSAEVENSVAAADESSGDTNVKSTNLMAASCNEPPKGQGAPKIGLSFAFTVEIQIFLSHSVACPFHRLGASRGCLQVVHADRLRRFRAQAR